MTRDDVIRMAREAGASFETAESMFSFAALVAAAEREACVWKVDKLWAQGPMVVIAAIRARGQK